MAGPNRRSDRTRHEKRKSRNPVASSSLPEGGGAIRGPGERFTATPPAGKGSMNVPVYTRPGRSGFEPRLLPTRDPVTGPFGLFRPLSLPSKTRKTDKGPPKSQDALESEVLILAVMGAMRSPMKTNVRMEPALP